MQDYIEVFRREAKDLYKNFKNNDESAKLRFTQVYGNRDDLSLMNAQHVIAKEYGFDSWDDIAKATKWELAGALNAAKNKTLTSPLKIWYGDDKINYGSAERFGTIVNDIKDRIDWNTFQEEYNGKKYDYIHFNNADVSYADLSKLDVIKVTFDEVTIWPTDKSKMPKDFNPREFMEKRKNPGLGLRNLHKQGIDGKNRNVAIISDEILRPHLEYRDNLVDYVNLKKNEKGVPHGGNYVGRLVGRTCGVAPKAKAYYYAVDKGDAAQYLEAFKKICELHKLLLRQGKNGIDVVLVTNSFLATDEFYEIFNELNNLGIFVCSFFPYERHSWEELVAIKEKMNMPFVFPNKPKPCVIECKMHGDIDNIEDYISPKGLQPEGLAFGCGGATLPCQYTIGSYIYYAQTSDEAWRCGLYVLAKSVKEDLTPNMFYEIALKTGDYRKGIGTIVNPQRLIEALQK